MPGLIELSIIVGLVILLFGYKRIPVMSGLLGRGVGEFKRSFNKVSKLPEFLSEIEEEQEKEKSRNDGEK